MITTLNKIEEKQHFRFINEKQIRTMVVIKDHLCFCPNCSLNVLSVRFGPDDENSYLCEDESKVELLSDRLSFTYMNRAKDLFYARILNPDDLTDFFTQLNESNGSKFELIADSLFDWNDNPDVRKNVVLSKSGDREIGILFSLKYQEAI